jgi:hypothetical protein
MKNDRRLLQYTRTRPWGTKIPPPSRSALFCVCVVLLWRRVIVVYTKDLSDDGNWIGQINMMRVRERERERKRTK